MAWMLGLSGCSMELMITPITTAQFTLSASRIQSYPMTIEPIFPTTISAPTTSPVPTQGESTRTPEPNITPTNELPTPAIVLPTLEGDLAAQISQLEVNTLRAESERYVAPEEQERADFSSLVEALKEGDLTMARDLAIQYDYELIRFIDQVEQNFQVYLLREEAPYRRGWGLYVFRMGESVGTNNIIVEAPHILADEGTPGIALSLFRGLNAQALLIAGAHRAANSDGSADVAHNSSSIFQVVHNALVTSTGQAQPPFVFQVHGFASSRHVSYPDIVLGGTSSDYTVMMRWLASFSQELTDQGFTVGVCDGIRWEDLCGDTNIQAFSLESGFFVHLEFDEYARTAPEALLDALQSMIEP